MKAKFIYEFDRNLDPLRAMNVGKTAKIIKDLEEKNIKESEVEILSDGTIYIKKYKAPWGFEEIQMKYLPEKKKKIVQDLHTRKNIEQIINDAIADGISLSDIKKLIEEIITKNDLRNRGTDDISQMKLIINKLSRTQETIDFEEEYNRYFFIGFMDKKPIKVKGKQYYEDKFNTETIVKVNKYDLSSVASLNGMMIRSRTQYPDGHVYYIDIPKEFMDEDVYYEIPDYLYDVFVKYKVKAR